MPVKLLLILRPQSFLRYHMISKRNLNVLIMLSIISGWKTRQEAHHGINYMDSKVNKSLKRNLLQKECSQFKIVTNGQYDSDKMMLVWRVISPSAFLMFPAREKQTSCSGFGACFVLV